MIDWCSLIQANDNGAPKVHLNVSSKSSLLADLEDCLRQDRGFSVVTLNLDHVVKFRDQPQFAAAYASMSHVTADGNPIVWLSRLAGEHVELVPGSELVAPVSELAAKTSVPIALVGSTEASLDAAGDALTSQYPGLKVAAKISPKMGFDPSSPEADASIATLKESGAKVAFLALGAPKQELLAQRIAAADPSIGTLSIGAGLDFVSGHQTRAPAWVRSLALEWMWRLLQSPGRFWRRYRDCLAILPRLTVGALSIRRDRKKQSLETNK